MSSFALLAGGDLHPNQKRMTDLKAGLVSKWNLGMEKVDAFYRTEQAQKAETAGFMERHSLRKISCASTQATSSFQDWFNKDNYALRVTMV